MQQLICTFCKEVKNAAQFHADATKGRGFSSQCKICKGARKKKQTYQILTQSRDRWLKRCFRRAFYRVKSRASYQGRDFSLTEEQFLSWALSDQRFNALYDEWDRIGRPKFCAPSLDRVDNSRGYSMDNVQFLSQHDNCCKGNRERVLPRRKQKRRKV